MLTEQKLNFETLQGYINAAHELQEVGDKDGCVSVLMKLNEKLEQAIESLKETADAYT